MDVTLKANSVSMKLGQSTSWYHKQWGKIDVFICMPSCFSLKKVGFVVVVVVVVVVVRESGIHHVWCINKKNICLALLLCITFYLFSFFFFFSFYYTKKKVNQMSLIYGLVARGATILAEHTNSSGNFATGNNLDLHSVRLLLIILFLCSNSSYP